MKKFNLIKPGQSILEVFFTPKTNPLSVFRNQVLRLSTVELIFLCNLMEQH